MPSPPTVVSHATLVNSLGVGLSATLEAIHARRSGLARCRFDGVTLETYVGEVAGLSDVSLPPALAEYDCRNNRLAQMGLLADHFSDAVADARARYGADRIGVFVGTSTSGISETENAYRHRLSGSGALPATFHYTQTQNTFSLGDFVQRRLGLAGPVTVISSACASSAKVFATASRALDAGIIDAAVVGGVDTLCMTTLYGFNALGLIAKSPCKPFDVHRDGISLGEGAGFALLERVSGSLAAGSHVVLGVGESCDAYHLSTPHPEGLGARLAMQRALDAAHLGPADIDYVNLHGTATRTNDASEDCAVFNLLGPDVPCSSTKGFTGHLLGAAGITETLLAMAAMDHDLMPGSLFTNERDPALRCNYLIENQHAPVRRILSNSFGFGGTNASVILGRTS